MSENKNEYPLRKSSGHEGGYTRHLKSGGKVRIIGGEVVLKAPGGEKVTLEVYRARAQEMIAESEKAIAAAKAELEGLPALLVAPTEEEIAAADAVEDEETDEEPEEEDDQE